ncbi:uncharacterized protein LOC131940835 [Physella acuta]|uniref:uncharacterized protein LOC131940835 n=1 Tax=Physella acuta TaxID=109671 RepID=UPI0027DCBAEF|nr:uncharacterized protein LOC131940835 [Physella acuta]
MTKRSIICDMVSGFKASSPAVNQQSQMDGLTVYLNGQSDGSSFLGKLPSVVLVNIFRFVDNKNELLRLASVCRSWRDLIYTTPTLWRNMHLKLCCDCKCLNTKKAFSNAIRFGCHLYELSISVCKHHKCYPNSCSLATVFRKCLQDLRHPTLTSIKINDIELREALTRTTPGISREMTRLVSRLDRLQCFKMTKAQWPIEEGNNLINTVLTTSRGTLQSLDIDGFFEEKSLAEKPVKLDQLTTGILSLTRLTKLGIDYILLTDDFVTSLSRSHAGQLQTLKLVASVILYGTTPHLISRKAWVNLTDACPAMKVAFYVDLDILEDSDFEILDPVLPIYKINFLEGYNLYELDDVLEYIAHNFRKSLVKLEGDIDSDNVLTDDVFLQFVRKCRRLRCVNVSDYFLKPETAKTAMKLIGDRKRRHDLIMLQGQPTKRTKTGPANGPCSNIAN